MTIEQNEFESELQGEEVEQPKKSLIETISLVDSLGIIGFGLYLAQFYLLLSCNVFESTDIFRDQRGLVFTFLLGEICASAVIPGLSKFMKGKGPFRAVAFASALVFLLPGVISLFSLPSLVFFVVWFLAGIGAVFFLGSWCFFLATLNHRAAVLYTALSVLVAGLVLVAVVGLFRGEFLPIASIAIPIISAWLLYSWSQAHWHGCEFDEFEKTRPYNVRSLVRTSAAMVANSFLLGFGFSVMASSVDFRGDLVVLVAVIGAAIFKVIDVQNGIRYQVGTIVTIIAPVAAVTFLFIPYLSSNAMYVLCTFSMLIAMINEIICWTAVAEYMHIHRVQPFANAAFGRLGDVIGLSLGFAFGVATLGEGLGTYYDGLFRGIVVTIFIIFQVFIFQDNSKSLSEHGVTAAEDIPSEAEETPEKDNAGTRVGAWQQRVRSIAEHYELTARQTEVLVLLAKGYSTAKIEEQLVVSSHTVKAHIYGIYQKTDVHSRQELIELIERQGL